MDEGTIRCACCGALVSPEVPEYYIEIESFRLLSERGVSMARRGSREYHDAMEKVRSEVVASYFHNLELYDRGHLWCPTCGSKLFSSEGEGE